MRDHHFIVVDAIHETARIAPARTIAITCRGGWAYNRFSRHVLDFSREIRERYGDTTLTGWLTLVFIQMARHVVQESPLALSPASRVRRASDS